ncbi:MAG: hypothetical protein EHM72_15695 [Calditrichaeota bacterium]|nr:MAG: hypothetical protein EHM72_15695 [Calditrichota bacterium]
MNNSADTSRVTMERAPLEQVSIIDKSMSKLFSDWILAENRRVEISIDQPDQHVREMMEWKIFMPESVQVNRTITFDQPRFNINVISFAPQSDHWMLEILEQNSDKAIKTFSLDDLKRWSDGKKAFEINTSNSTFPTWDGRTDAGFDKLDRSYFCRFRLEEMIPHISNDGDTLFVRRRFTTEPFSFSVFMKTEVLMNQIFSLYEYDESQPISDVVFGRNLIKPVLDKIENYLLENRQINVRFLGHTDRIGTEEHNKTILSPKRAEQLWNAFLKLARESNYPNEIITMILNSKPNLNDYLGWDQPLRIQVDNQNKSEDVLLGDNETPIGRNYNRRSEVLIIEER